MVRRRLIQVTTSPPARLVALSDAQEHNPFSMDGVQIVFVAVVATRFILPLFIPRYPLPAIIGCLVVDAADQSIFQAFGYDPPGYQSYDKAMDVFYLAIAYLATLRNWEALAAYRVAQFLYFYRLVGVVAFELSGVRALLLVFPNTFEYFFIAYEAIRTRWAPAAYALRWWVVTAGLIWVFVKLPQEWWIHVAQLDVTDFLAEHSWATPLLVALILAGLAVFWFVIKPRLRAPDHAWQFAAVPMPEPMDTAAEMSAWRATHGRVRSFQTLEKVVLLGLLSVIFSQSLPGVRASNFDLFVGVAAVVVVNTVITLAVARRGSSVESVAIQFGSRLLLNLAIVVAGDWLLGLDGGSIDQGDTFFFLMLISLITTLHDRYTPVLEYRQEEAAGTAPATGKSGE